MCVAVSATLGTRELECPCGSLCSLCEGALLCGSSSFVGERVGEKSGWGQMFVPGKVLEVCLQGMRA